MLSHAFTTVATALLASSMLTNASDARSVVQAQAPAERAASPGTDPRVERFRKQLELDRQALKIPGLSAVILEDGKVLWIEGFGYADVEKQIPATPDTLYHIASLTKTFAAILTLQLVEEGRFSLDEEVSLYTSAIQDSRVRIKHLLSHTSDGTPGEKFSYNPPRFEYLKDVLEKETGKSIRQLYVETFLDPLGMRDSMPGPDVADDDKKWAVLGADKLARYREVLKRFAKPYTYYGDGEILPCSYPTRDFFVSAGLLSTVRDMAKYDAAVDSHKFLSEAMQSRAWTPFVSNDGKPLAHGLGWYVTDYRGMRIVWHYGHWGTGFSAMYLKIPAKRLTCIVLTNSEALSDHFFQMGENVTHNVIGCSFINTFVPEVANAAVRASGESGDSKPGDAMGTTTESVTAPAWGTDAYFAASTDCECTSRIAVTKWIESRRAKARNSIPITPELAEACAGSYQLPDRAISVTRDGNRLFVDVPKGERTELFAESPTQFFSKIQPWTLTIVGENDRIVRVEFLDAGFIIPAPKIQ